MKTLYIVVGIFVILMVALLALSFIYLERDRHQTYLFLVREDGRDSGVITINKHSTEDKKIISSVHLSG